MRVAALVLCLGMAACGGKSAPSAAVAPPLGSGGTAGDPGAWQRFARHTPAKITCGELPVLLQESRTSTSLSGRCGYVRVAGDHNDIDIELAPGGTIEITGEHNDVSWTQPDASVSPNLVNAGASDSFHPPPPGP